MIVGGLAIVAICTGIRFLVGGDSAQADPPRPTASAPSRPSAQARPITPIAPVEPAAAVASRPATPTRSPSTAPPQAVTVATAKLVAEINGVKVTRDELAEECLTHYGKDVLESMVNKYLISEACKQRNIVVSRAEVDGEIERMAQRFNLPVEQWLKMLKQERGIKPMQYASDIIWPTLALRKLAGERLKVSAEEIDAAFEMHYGESVRCRLIAVRDRALAEQVRAAAAANPAEFGNLAKQHSEDSSASVKGLIPPIRHHGSFPEIEKTAFEMKDGAVSPVLAVGEQFIVLLREGKLPASNVDRAQVKLQLEEVVREKKMRTVAAEIFQQLQQQSRVENVMNDPAKRRAMPGVAATINGAPISLRELGEHCLERYGEDVLEGLINRRLLEQACKKRNITITEADLDAEIAQAASDMLPPKADGSPDIEGWLASVTQEQNVSLEVYRRDAVWPSVALKKLVGDDVEVTKEDMQRGFEANYGPRVRCRAIVLNNGRRAQEVWEMARRKPTVENFGNLAEAYSVEPGSQALRGEVPPVQRHGGQPQLEEAAFALQPGELSPIVEVGDKWVILMCEGYTEPVPVSQKDAEADIYRDLYDKKQRLAMSRYFDMLRNSATIDNLLAGTSTSPQPKQPAGPALPGGTGPAISSRPTAAPAPLRR
jgi:parvulin-like peptidyl-prolyl isomerase